jgi:ATP/ADP translocase
MCKELKEVYSDVKGTWLLLTSILVAIFIVFAIQILPRESIIESMAMFFLFCYFWITFTMVSLEQMIYELENQDQEYEEVLDE